MPLNEEQLRRLDVLEWLHDPNARREGRTRMLAVAAIRVACLNPGVGIHLFDHTGIHIGSRYLQQMVEAFVESDFRLRPFAVYSRTTLTLNIPRPLFNWQPLEDELRDVYERGVAAAERARGRRPPDPMETISQEMADRFVAELEMRDVPRADGTTTGLLAHPNRLVEVSPPLEIAATESPKKAVVVPKKKRVPKPKSVWERLLADNDD